MKIRKPTHPGAILREDVLPELQMTITDFAAHLGFSRETISRILHERAPVSANLAYRLELAGVSSADLWLKLQAAYDIWQLKTAPQPLQIKPLNLAAPLTV
ncbi:HigA family addiction module antitoxin [Testudinibacter sp. P80/BLE/0925]|uniref:HigA family addiction module antitoxin n=1 Tax=Testudinibacter sp. TW-1 TaxID=3417757 RepID=UPI003D35FC6C